MRRKTVSDYSQQAFRRLDARSLPSIEPCRLVFGEDHACAGFALSGHAGRIVEAAYRCTTCATLMALCEHLSEFAIGRSVEEARRFDADLLLSLHPEIPAARRNRAALAARAFQLAVESLILGVTP